MSEEVDFETRPFYGGLVFPDVEEKTKYTAMYPISNLGWEAPDVVEVKLTVPLKETSGGITTNLISWYDQGPHGTCVGFSGSWCTTERNSTSEQARKYDALELYKQCRREMGQNPNDLDSGATMVSCGKALKNWGHILVIGNTDQPVSKDEGIESYYWGKSADDARLAISQGRVVHLGINWYSKFMTPKKDANGRYWLCSDDQKTWGRIVGGHAIMMFWWSDALDAGCLKNTWGGGFPGEVWLSRKSLNILLSEGGEMLLCIDRNPVPTGKLVMVDPFTLSTESSNWPPVIGDKLKAHVHVKNGGTADLSLNYFGIKGGRIDGEVWDAALPLPSLKVNEEYEVDIVWDNQFIPGNYSFQIVYDDGTGMKPLGTSVTFTVVKPPEPPLDQLTVDIRVKRDGVTYGLDGIILPKL